MNEGEVTGREFEQLLRSIDASQQSSAESGKVTASTLAEIKEYMLHNDYRHVATEAKVEALEVNMAVLVEILESRNSMWRAFKKGKLIISIIIAGILTAAGTGLFNYVTKPVINQHKEKPKIEVKIETKDSIE